MVMQVGWEASAAGWIESMGEKGDDTRRYVLDMPMLAVLPSTGALLDIGCGEGRFCRMAKARGMEATGIDPTVGVLDRARGLDPKGTYVEATAEDLPFEDAVFDVTVFYLTLIDIPDFRAAIVEAARVLKPGGQMLIANLHPYVTARPRNWKGEGGHWVEKKGERVHLAVDDMMEERACIASWGDIRIENHHRPLSAYMGALLGCGLRLKSFEDPMATGPDQAFIDRYRRMPWAYMMLWKKPV